MAADDFISERQMLDPVLILKSVPILNKYQSFPDALEVCYSFLPIPSRNKKRRNLPRGADEIDSITASDKPISWIPVKIQKLPCYQSSCY